MISYDSYVKKIKKVKTVKNTIHRFRVLIISVLCAASASTAGFLVSKGVVTQNVELPETIVYGETYGISEAKVLFSKVKYQFSTQGTDNWSSEKPTVPGDYSVRAVTEKSFNIKGYGKAVNFTILPKPVDLEVTSSSIVYGDDPTINTDFLVNGDRIESVGFEYDDILSSTTNVKVDTDEIVIKNKEGQDITAFYNFNAVKKEIKISKKQLTIEPLLLGKTYDGLALDYDNEVKELTTNNIAKGDELQLTTIIKDSDGKVLDEMPKDAGTYTLSVDEEKTKIINKETNVDMTSVYSISYKTITFKINQRNLTIAPIPFEDKVYNGEAYSYSDEFGNFVYQNEDNGQNRLVDGESIKVNVEYSSIKGYKEALNADVYTMNIVSFDVGENTNLNNYKITTRKSSFEIEKRKVSLLPIDLGNKIYDGIEYVYVDEFNNFEYKDGVTEINKLVEGESVKVVIHIGNINYNNILNAGDYTLRISNVVAADNTLLDNYNFELLTRELVISKRDVTIDLLDINEENNKIYDGVAVDFDENNYTVSSALDMVEGETLSFTIGFSGEETIVNAGLYVVEELSYNIENGLMDNYNITFNGYNYEIKPRPVSIIIKEFEETTKVYDGVYTSHDNTWDYVEDSLSMVDGETLSVVVGFEGSKGINYSIKDADSYMVKVTDFVVENGLEANYTFDASSYEFLIEKRDLIIRPYNFGDEEDKEKISNSEVYNGLTYTYNNLEYNNFFIVEGSIVEGEYFNVQVEVSAEEVKNAGTYTLRILEGIYSPLYSTNLDNYNIVIEDVVVEFVIEKRTLEIKANTNYLYNEETGFQTYGNEQVYNNEPLKYYNDIFNFDTVGEYGVLENENIYVEVNFYRNDILFESIKDAGEYQLVINNVLFKEAALPDNYNIVISEDVATYLVTPREIIIGLETIENGVKTYDGKEVINSAKTNNFILHEGTLAPLDELKVNVILKDEEEKIIDFAVDAGIYTWEFVEIVGINTDVNNYNVTFLNDIKTTTFEIARREVTIELYKVDEIYSHIYDGTYFDTSLVAFNVVSELDMVEGETLSVNVKIDGETTLKDAGTHYVSVVNNEANTLNVEDDYLVTNGKRSNYVFNTVGFEYIINKRDVTIRANTFNDKEKAYNEAVYNGETYIYDNESFGNFVVVNGSFVSIPEKNIEENIRVIVDIYDQNEVKQDSIKNVGEYKMIIREGEYTPNSQTNLDNYNITIDKEKAEFRITKRSVKLELFDIVIEDYSPNTKVYDGKEVEFNETKGQGWDYHADTEYLMVDGEILTIDVKFDGQDSVKNVKTEDGLVVSYSVYVNEYFVENGLVSNYDFQTDTKEFLINPREITIRPYNIDKENEKSDLVYNSEVYDGTYYNYNLDQNNFVILEGSIVENEYIRVYTDISCKDWDVDTYGIINVGQYVISINKQTMEFENTLKENYSINCEETVTFEILKRKVTLSVNDLIFSSTGGVNEKIYDGYYQSHNTGYTDLGKDYTLLPNEPLSAVVSFKDVDTEEFTYEIKDAGEYLATIRLEDMSLPTGYFLSNYDFTIVELLVTINKREVSIKLDRFADTMYEGETYVYPSASYDESESALKVVEGESLLLDVRFNGEEYAKDVDTYVVAISSLKGNEKGEEDGIKVVNGLRSNYIFTVDSYEFTISKRPITIRPFNFDYSEELGYYSYYSIDYNEEVYNGLTYVYSQGYGNFAYVDGSLEVVEGENLSVNIARIGENKDLTIKDVGQYILGITSVKGDSVTNVDNYDINYDTTIEFVITPRPIKITPKDINETNTRIYDSTETTYKYTFGNYDITSGSIVEGEDFRVIVVFDGEISIVDVKEGGYSYWISSIEEKKGTKLSNYDIDMSDIKTFTITPRPISIIASNEKLIDTTTDKPIYKNLVEYNGHYYDYLSENNNFGYLAKSLKVVGKDAFVATVTINDLEASMFKDAGYYDFKIIKVTPVGDTKATNYEINIESVYTFEITPRKVTIRPTNFDYETVTSTAYENKEQYNGHTYVYSTDWNNFVTTKNTIVEGEQIKVKVLFNDSKDVEVKDVNVYKISIIDQEYEYGNTTKASNYDIELDTKNVVFEIERRKVSVKLETLIDKDYDGKEVGYDEAKFTLPNQGMVKGEELSIDVVFTNKSTKESTSTVINAADYYVEIADYIVTNGKESNYKFTQDNIQTYRIKRRKMTIAPDIGTGKEYDGIEVTYNNNVKGNYVISNGSFVEGEDLAITVSFQEKGVDYPSVVNSGTYTVYTASYSYFGNFLEQNYDITWVSKEYKITARKVTLALNKTVYGDKGTWTFDGSYFDIDNSYTDVDNRICKDDVIVLDIAFVNKETTDDNYSYYVKDAGEYKVIYRGYTTNGTTELNKNYDLTILGVEDINLVINKRAVVVILDDINEGNTHAYNKEYLAFDNSKFTTINNMVEGETLEIYVKFKYLENKEITASIIDVGIYEVFVATYTVRGGNIENYSFSQEEVYNYEITKRDVYMTLANYYDKTYDGNYYDADGNCYPTYPLDMENTWFLAGDNYVPFEVSFKNKETLEISQRVVNEGTYEVIREVGENDEYVLRNYNVVISNLEDGTLNSEFTISKRDITINVTNKYLSGIYGDVSYGYDNVQFEVSEADESILHSHFVNMNVLFNGLSYQEAKNAGTYLVTLNEEDFAIYRSSDGENATRNFNYTVNGLNQEFEIEKRHITIELINPDERDSITYNGKVHKEEVVIHNMAYNEDRKVRVETETFRLLVDTEKPGATDPFDSIYSPKEAIEAKDVGTYIADINPNINWGVVDMNNYIFNIEEDVINNVFFQIKPINITIAPKTVTNFYYGDKTYTAQNQYRVLSGSFVNKEGIEVVTKLEGDIVADDGTIVERFVAEEAGTYIEVICSVKPINQTNLTNYNITLKESTITILPREYYIKPIDRLVSYNGEIFEYETYVGNFVYCDQFGNYLSADEMFTHEQLRITEIEYYSYTSGNYTYAPSEIGEYAMNVTGWDVVDGNVANYKVTSFTGHLIIDKPFVSIEFNDAIFKTYDGQPYTITNEWYYSSAHIDGQTYYLPEGFTLVLDNYYRKDGRYYGYTISDPGYYDIDYSNYKIYDPYGNDSTDNFRLIMTWPYANIDYIRMHIKPVYSEKTYDGIDLTAPTDEVEIVDFSSTGIEFENEEEGYYWSFLDTNGMLLEGHHIRVETSKSLDSPGKVLTNEIIYYEIYDDYGNVIQSSDTGKIYYEIYHNIDQLNVPSYIKAATKNKLKKAYQQTLKMNARYVNVTAEDINISYGNTYTPYFTVNTRYMGDEGLLPGHRIESYISALDTKDPGEYEINVRYYVYDEKGKKVTNCYEIENSRKINLNIAPKLITITVGSAIVQFDPLNPNYEFTHDEFSISEEDRLFLEERDLLIDCVISGFISKPGVAINTIKNPEKDVLIYKVLSEKYEKIKDYTNCFTFEIRDGQLVMYE